MNPLKMMLAGAALLFSACNEKPAPQSQPDSLSKREVAKPAFSVPDTFKVALGNVFEGYTRIQSALAQDDLARAQAAFSSMHALLHMMPKEGLDSSAIAYWSRTDSEIMDVLHPLETAVTLETTRMQFSEFSRILVDAIDTIGISGQHPVYQFHCPMARENKGADWLQMDTTLANPYFGQSMLTCGSLVRKI